MDRTFANNAGTTLVASISAATLVLQVVDAGSFPVPPFDVTLESVDGTKIEICRCTDVNGNQLTVTRAQEGTLADSFSSKDLVSHRLTAGALTEFKTEIADNAAAIAAHEADSENPHAVTAEQAGAVPIACMDGHCIQVVAALPDPQDANTIYFVTG